MVDFEVKRSSYHEGQKMDRNSHSTGFHREARVADQLCNHSLAPLDWPRFMQVLPVCSKGYPVPCPLRTTACSVSRTDQLLNLLVLFTFIQTSPDTDFSCQDADPMFQSLP